MGSGNGLGIMMTIVSVLYLLSTICLIESILTIYLFAKQSVDSTTLTSLILVFISSVVSLIYGFFHSIIARRYRNSESRTLPRTKLLSITKILPRLLIVLWMGSSAAGLVVAAREPYCMVGRLSKDFWKMGESCEIHRATVALSVCALILSCTLFCSSEIASRPFYASFNGIFEPLPEHQFHLGPSPSTTSWSTASTADSLKKQKIYQARLSDQDLHSDRAAYFQRRNSLSTQNALYPPGSRYLTRPGSTLRSSSTSSVPSLMTHSSLSHSSSTRTTSTISSDGIPSIFASPYGSRAPSRAVSSVSSLGHNPSKKSPLSAMRRISEPEVPTIPDKYLSGHFDLPMQRKSGLADLWSPNIYHAPLSADPLIRAFSDGSYIAEPKVEPKRPARPQTALSSHPPDFLDPKLDLTLGVRPRSSPAPPELPRRARGHIARQSSSDGKLRSRTTSAPSLAPTIAVPALPVFASQNRPLASVIQAQPRTTTSQTPKPSRTASSDALAIRKTRSTQLVNKTSATNNSKPSATYYQPFPPQTKSKSSSPPQSLTVPSARDSSAPRAQPTPGISTDDYGNGGLGRGTSTHLSVPSSEMLEQQRLRARFSEARIKEAAEYGMGPWKAPSTSSSTSSSSSTSPNSSLTSHENSLNQQQMKQMQQQVDHLPVVPLGLPPSLPALQTLNMQQYRCEKIVIPNVQSDKERREGVAAAQGEIRHRRPSSSSKLRSRSQKSTRDRERGRRTLTPIENGSDNNRKRTSRSRSLERRVNLKMKGMQMSQQGGGGRGLGLRIVSRD